MIEELGELQHIFHKYPDIKLVYLFGSRTSGKQGPLSDFDFALFIDSRDIKAMYDLKFRLMDEISLLLKTDKVDITILNLTESPELKYFIITSGTLLIEREPFKVLLEPRILNEYFDFHSMLLRNSLTRT